MARTKQMARRSTGGKSPIRHRKPANCSAAQAAKEAAKEQTRNSQEDNEDGGGSYLLTAQSLEPSDSMPARHHSESLEKWGEDAASVPRLTTDGLYDGEDEDRDGDPASTTATRRKRQTLHALSSTAAATIDQTQHGYSDRHPKHAAASVSRMHNTNTKNFQDGIEVITLGHIPSFASIFKVPAAPENHLMNEWLPATVTCGSVNPDCTTWILQDSGSVVFGKLQKSDAAALCSLAKSPMSKDFGFRLKLGARPKSVGECVGATSTLRIPVNIAIFAAQRSADGVRDKLRERGVHPVPIPADTGNTSVQGNTYNLQLEVMTEESNCDHHQGSSSIPLRPPYEDDRSCSFQGEVARLRAESRAQEEEEDREMRHPPKVQSSDLAAEVVEVRYLEPKSLTDVGDKRNPSLPCVLSESAPADSMQSGKAEDTLEDNASGDALDSSSNVLEHSEDVDMIDVSDPVAAVIVEPLKDPPVPFEQPMIEDSKDERGLNVKGATPTKADSTLAQLEVIDEVSAEQSAFSFFSPSAQDKAVVSGDDHHISAWSDQHNPPLAFQEATLASQDHSHTDHKYTATTPVDLQREISSPHAALTEAQQLMVVPPTALNESPAPAYNEGDLEDFLEYTNTASQHTAEQYVTAGGSVRQAVRNFRQDQETLRVADKVAQSWADQPKPLTLLEEALKVELVNPAKWRKKERQAQADTLIILDGCDFSRNCRLNSSDLCEALPTFDVETIPRDGDLTGVQGVRRLYILLHSSNGEMPKLQRKSLNTTKDDCAGEILISATTSDLLDYIIAKTGARVTPVEANQQYEARNSGQDVRIKLEEVVAAELQREAQEPQKEDSREAIDWQTGYEDFFCILTRFKPTYFGAELASIIPRLEAVAQIAGHYEAISLASPVTDSMTDLFNKCRIDNQLWESIAGDSARWLLLAIDLKNVSIFKEAYVHVVGCFPHWPWSVPQTSFSSAVFESIEIKSFQVRTQCREVERKLMLTTLSGRNESRDLGGTIVPASQNNSPTTYNVVNLWTDWIKNHLGHLDEPSGTILPSELCIHPEGAECLNIAGFYRRLHKGGAAYLPIAQVLSNWNHGDFRHQRGLPAPTSEWEVNVRADLSALKKRASELVEPLAWVNLNFEGNLDYLTCIEVEDDDLPWEKEIAGDEGGEDESMA